MIIQKQTHLLIKEIAKKYGLSIKATREIINSQFLYLKEEMAIGEKDEYPTFRNVLIKHLGTFHASENRIKHLKSKKKIKRYGE